MDDTPSSAVSKRTVLILVGISDVLIGAAILLIYFGFLPVEFAAWGIPRWAVGLVGGLWFMSALAFVTYQVTKTDITE